MAERKGIIKGSRIYLENGFVFEQANCVDLLGGEGAQNALQNDRRCLETTFRETPLQVEHRRSDQNRINELSWPKEDGTNSDRRWNFDIRKEDIGF